PEVRRALRPLLEELGCHAEALEVLHAEVADADPEARQPLLEYGAELAATHLDDDALRPWLERLVAERPDDPELWLRLAALHERGRRPAARERALRATCAVLARTDAEPERLRDLQLERARILERELGAPARAIAALEAARASDPEHETALVELDRLYTEQGRPRQLAELLDTRIARARDAARFELERRAAQVRADELGEMERAAEIWLGLLRAGAIASEERAASLPRIARVLRAAGRLEAWAELAEEELEASTGESALSLRRELAATWMAPLARPERALPHLRALVDAGKARDAESLALLDALRAAGDAVELARRLEQRLQQHPDDPGGWTELARLREERLWAPGAAARAWSHVLELDPTARAAMAGLRRASERLGDWAEVAHWLEREIAVGLPGPALAWRRVARLHWERLGDAANAERAFGAAHDIDPTDPEALRGLQKIALARRQWSRAIELFEDELELLAGPGTEAARAALWLRIAELATGPAQEPARADRAFVEADATGELGAAELAAWADVRALGGRDAAWCEVFERWCAHADAEPLARDWLALAECHEAQDRAEGARRCLERGLELDPQDGAGWQLAARLAERTGDRSAAADAWARAADLAPGPAAARALTRAAAHLEGRDPLAAADLLERAVARDRTATAANAALARVAARVDRVERATAAAGRLLELAEAAHDVPAHEALAAFLAGARSARALARWEDVADLSAAALEVEALCAEALALSGEASHRLEDWKRCRAHLEALLSLPECDDERTRHAARLGRALEALGREQDALARFEQALTDGPDLEDAHAGRARVLEALGRREEAAGAWAAWAERSGDPRRRAERLARAARLELEAGLSERAERWLRGALDADPDCAEAAVALATALWQADRRDEAFEVATTSADRLSDDGAVAALESVRGRTFEARGESPSALAAYRRAAQSDPDALEAGLAAARLLRASGAWRAAESWLVELSERHARPEGRAELLLATGRLRAGPLEDMSGAIDAYRSALELAPGREDVREVLAALLEHVPAHAGEARDEHRRLLAGEPTRTRSIRSLVRLARESSSARDARAGLAILRALGAASAEEREQAPARLEFSVSGSTGADPVRASLEDALGAGASLWAEIAAHNEVLSAPRAGRESTHKAGGHPIAAQRRAYLQAEAERAGPGLLALAPQDFEAAVRALLQAGGLVLPGQAPGGAEPLRLELGARQRRKLRRTLRELDPAAIDGLDFASWQQELRATVMARALDAAGGDLRAALLVLLEESGEAEVEALPPEADLTRWVAATPSARLLLGQVLSAWTG
ncbi:MAG: hypothetical protein QNK03_28595, partial [Myxococcota bacterium]|nr:hypothetical protein [Myxococcota bacterium]